MNNQVASLLPYLPPSLPPFSSIAPHFQADIVLAFGEDEVSVFMELPVHSREETDVQQEFHGCILSGGPVSSGETRSDL